MGLDSALDHAWEVGTKWIKRFKWIILAVGLYFAGDKVVQWVEETTVRIATNAKNFDKATDSLKNEIKLLKQKYKKYKGD